MEMKQINETTLKIMITMEDLEEHGMELKDFLIPQEKTEEFFYTVMDELDLPDNFKNSGMLKNSSKLLKITLWIREILKPTISSKSMIRP